MQANGSSVLGKDCCYCAGLLTPGVALLCKNKEEGGSARASLVAALMPKSVSFSEEKKECLWGANISRMEICIRIGVPFSDGVALYL